VMNHQRRGGICWTRTSDIQIVSTMLN
jgi:hypothetical protein